LQALDANGPVIGLVVVDLSDDNVALDAKATPARLFGILGNLTARYM
jgi:hypothetical protein